MIKKTKIIIGITMGDPSGIGPEIILKSFENPEIRSNRLIVIGDYSVMVEAHKMLKIKSFKLTGFLMPVNVFLITGDLNILDLHLINMNELHPGKVQAISGNAAFECIRKAVELAKNKDIDAIATAPLNKEALHLAGHKYPGHTEILAALTQTPDYAMLLYDKKLSVIHVSTHVSLLEAITRLKKERIEKVIDWQIMQ